MGEAGRKLTIRMPDNPQLRSVEVAQLHIDPGERVPSGTPVMSLHKKRRDHIVRAPRPGRVVPLVALGDVLQPGDPLYILHLDEQALIEENRASKALVVAEQAKWSDGIKPDLIEPIARSRGVSKPEPWPSRFARNWGKPILAIALYVLACFALLPILHTFGKEASLPVLIGMCTGAVLFGALIYYLYAPNAGPGPRWTVRLVAASWIGISALAIFYRPPVDEDITLAEATNRVEALFTEEQPPAPAPRAVDTPAPVFATGVRIDGPAVRTVPERTAPRSVLVAADWTPDPHGVTVRTWARLNPTGEAGTVITFEQADRGPQAGPGPSLLPGLGVVPADQVPAVELALQAEVAVARALAPPVRATTALPGAAPETPRPGTAPTFVPARDAAPVSDVLLAALSGAVGPGASGSTAPLDPATLEAETLRSETWLREAGLPVMLSDAVATPAPAADTWQAQTASAGPGYAREVAAPLPSRRIAGAPVLARAGPGAWLDRNGLPVPQSGPAAPGLADAGDWSVALASAGPEIARGAPSGLGPTRVPDLLLVLALRAGDSAWMTDQTALLAGLPETAGQGAAGNAAESRPGPEIARRSLAVLGAIPAIAPLPGGVMVQDAGAGDAVAAPRVATAQLRLALAPADRMVDAPTVSPPPSTPGPLPGLETAALPGAVPPIPTYDPAGEDRLLLFVYFDDPRIEDHPGVGDRWEAPVSPDLAGAVLESEVVAVKQIVQVEEWCEAASNPDVALSADAPAAVRTAWLNDRIRLLEVRVTVDAGRIADYEREVPLFGGTPAGFFHNRAPLMGAAPGAPILDEGMAYLRSLAAGLVDPGEVMAGGQYFDSPAALAAVLRGAGCARASWNGGDGPENAIGRALDAALDG